MIPKIIHHVWPGADPFKEKFHNFRNSWMKNHPDWTFYFWRLDNLPENFNPEIKEFLHNENYTVTPKSDLLRFEILRLFGGIYVDTDMESLKSIEVFRDLDFFTGYENNNGTICPSLIGSIPNHEILCKTIELSLNNLKDYDVNYTNKKPNKVTGVQPFTKIVEKHLDDKKIKIFSKEYFYPVHYDEKHKLDQETPDAYTKHYWSGLDSDGWVSSLNFTK